VELTLALHAVPVNTRAADHDIVNDGEATLASHPITLAILQATIGQDSCLVQTHPSTMHGLGQRELVRVEELPY
jgi:hypothetical protein